MDRFWPGRGAVVEVCGRANQGVGPAVAGQGTARWLGRGARTQSRHLLAHRGALRGADLHDGVWGARIHFRARGECDFDAADAARVLRARRLRARGRVVVGARDRCARRSCLPQSRRCGRDAGGGDRRGIHPALCARGFRLHRAAHLTADVTSAAEAAMPWLAALPLLSAAAYLFDGVFLRLRQGALDVAHHDRCGARVLCGVVAWRFSRRTPTRATSTCGARSSCSTCAAGCSLDSRTCGSRVRGRGWLARPRDRARPRLAS